MHKIGSLEILRLKEKNKDLLETLKRLSAEVDGRLAHAEFRTPRKELPVTEGLLLNQLDCLNREEQMLQTEMKYINKKLRVNTNGEHVVTLEKKLAEALRRNEQLGRTLRLQARKVDKEDRRIQVTTLTRVNATPPQKEVRLDLDQGSNRRRGY